MENEIQPLEPQIEPSMDATNQQGLLPNGEVDHEGAMAKADLFKLGQYSYKLFKKLEDDTQLEAWVQAKITKAADYIASVYHYMEYEMKFSEYGKKLDDSDVLSESQKKIMKNKLMEAKSKIRDLKIAEAKKTNKDPVAKNLNKFNVPKVEDDKKKKEKSGYNKHKNKDMQLDELSKDTLKSYTKRAAKDIDNKAYQLGKIASKPDYSADEFAKIDNITRKRKKGIEKAVDKMEESKKPSAGLSKAEKSKVVRDAKTKTDIGKPGKSFKDVAKTAAKKYGSKKSGEKVAAAAMWKNIKETQEMAFGEGVYDDIFKKPKGLKMKPGAVGKVANDYDEKASELGKKLRNVDSTTPDDEYKDISDKYTKAANKAAHAFGRAQGKSPRFNGKKAKYKEKPENEKEPVNESAELDRMKEFLTRLNG